MAAMHLRPRLGTNFSDSTAAADNLFSDDIINRSVWEMLLHVQLIIHVC